MKKFLDVNLILVLLILIYFFIPTSNIFAAGVGVNIDGRNVVFTQNSGAPFIDGSSRTQVPLRITMEAYGCSVEWNSAERIAIVKKNDITVEVPVGQSYILVNDVKRTNDTAALIKDNRTYLPIRVVLEAFGATVNWNKAKYQVEVVSGIANNLITKVPLSAKEIYNTNSKAVVFLHNTSTSGDEYTGTGFIYSSDGKIITNYHVIENARTLGIYMNDGSLYSGSLKVIAYDKEKDLAILKTTMINAPYVKLGNSNDIDVGDDVIAIGNPLGLQNTLSSGLISSIRVGLIQITAPISPGSSGGVLLNMQGEAIGITSSGAPDGENIGFAIPINEINKLNFTAGYSLQDLFGTAVSTNNTYHMSLNEYEDYLNQERYSYTTSDNAHKVIYNYLITENQDGSITVGAYCESDEDKSELFDLAADYYREVEQDTLYFAQSIYQDTGRATSVMLVLDDYLNYFDADLLDNAIYQDTLEYDANMGSWWLWFPILEVRYDGRNSSALWFYE